MRGGQVLSDSLAAHAKCYINFAAGETEPQGLFAAASTALHVLVTYRVAGCSSAHGMLLVPRGNIWLS